MRPSRYTYASAIVCRSGLRWSGRSSASLGDLMADCLIGPDAFSVIRRSSRRRPLALWSCQLPYRHCGRPLLVLSSSRTQEDLPRRDGGPSDFGLAVSEGELSMTRVGIGACQSATAPPAGL